MGGFPSFWPPPPHPAGSQNHTCGRMVAGRGLLGRVVQGWTSIPDLGQGFRIKCNKRKIERNENTYCAVRACCAVDGRVSWVCELGLRVGGERSVEIAMRIHRCWWRAV
jgi:hypothetical protein